MDTRGEYLNSDRITSRCQNLGDFEVSVEWISSGRNECVGQGSGTYWMITLETSRTRRPMPLRVIPLLAPIYRPLINRQRMLEQLSGTYKGGVRTNPNNLISFEGGYRHVCTSSERKKTERYTSEDDRFVRISSDSRLESGQGRNSNGGSAGSSGSAVRITA